MMAHAETCVKPVMRFGGTLLGKLQLDPKLRELCLLRAVKLEGGEYEWVQHVPIARDLGCSEDQIAALEDDDDTASCFDACERAALQFTREVVLDVRASGETLAQVRTHLSDREIVELILVAGFYITLARLTETLGVETEPPIGSVLIRDIEKRVAAKKGLAP
jgi:alkylhydroperoxidase family enzyme